MTNFQMKASSQTRSESPCKGRVVFSFFWIVGIAVNVFSIDGEHWLLNRLFSCWGSFGIPYIFASICLVETPTAAVANERAARDLRFKPAASLRDSQAECPSSVLLTTATVLTHLPSSSLVTTALKAFSTSANTNWANSKSLPSIPSDDLKVDTVELLTSVISIVDSICRLIFNFIYNYPKL